MKRKLRIIVDCGDTFCAGCSEVAREDYGNGPVLCSLFGKYLEVAGDTKPKRHAKCLEAEGMR